MSNVLNFNRHRPPILPVELLDDACTVLHLTPPTVDLLEELRAKAAELNTLLTGDDEDIRTGLFDLAARLMSCNRNMRKISPEQLRATYRIDEEDLIVFYQAYTDFIRSIENAKN
jgi:hypothetical protein